MMLNILFGGELAAEISEKIAARARDINIETEIVNMRDFKNLKLESGCASGFMIVIIQTVENDEPPEAAGSCVRFFKRKTNSTDMLRGISYTVLAVGDSNLLLDRQTTGAKDCNKVGQSLDVRLHELGATRFFEIGLADERTGLKEVEPWLDSMLPALQIAMAKTS